MGNGISSDKPTRREKFTPSVNDQQAAYVQENAMRYNTTEPNIYIIPVENQSNISDPANTHDMFGVFNMYNNSNNEGRQISVSPLSRIFDFMVSPTVSADLIASNNFCKSFNSLNRNVSYYYSNYYNALADTRCGWTYNPNFNGQVRFEGHLGHNGNPITSLDSTYITHSNTRWYWNLADAIVAFNRYKCQVTVSNCSNIDSHPDCVWSRGLGYAIPLVQSGNYRPEETSVDEASTTCLRTPTADPASPSASYVISDLPSCPKNNEISRDCLYNLLSNTKCHTGALHHALETVGLSNYGITAIPSFMKYNQLYPANNNLFNGGANTTVQGALDYFIQLSNNAYSSCNALSNFAARDLCQTRNTYQTFDFCTEYVPETTRPQSGWLMNCIQDTFRRKGGQITGTQYPTTSNMAFWNQFNTWGQINLYIDTLESNTSSSSIDVQAAAYSKLYGIPTEQYINVLRVPGIEVFWFSIINSSANSPGTIDTFLGRRIQDDLTLQTPTPSQTTNIQFISFFNLRTDVNNKKIQFRYTVKNGIKVLKNAWINTLNDNSEPNSYGQIMAAWYPVTTPTSYSNASNEPTDCWTLSSNNANYFTISWHTGETAGSFSNNYFKTCGPNSVPISATDFTMSQEPDAPMLSYQVFPTPTQSQLQYFTTDQTLSYFFGDTRLRKVFPIDNTGSVSPDGFINSNEHFGFSNRYTELRSTYVSRSYIYGSIRTSSSGILQTGKIGSESWRTITMLFKTGSLGDIIGIGTTYYIFQYGMLSIGIKNIGSTSSPDYKCVINKRSGSELGDTQLHTILRDTYYYLILIQDIDPEYAITYPTTLRICCAPLTSVKANTQLPFISGSNVKYFKEEGQRLFPGTGIQASIGGNNSLGNTQTVVMDVGWLRFFDYSFTTEDVNKDVNNAWQKQWFNMI